MELSYRTRRGFQVFPTHSGCTCCAAPVDPLRLGDKAKQDYDCRCVNVQAHTGKGVSK